MAKSEPPVLYVTFFTLMLSIICRDTTALSSRIDKANMALKNSPAATRLVTHKMCPFAQKAWIALECSKAPYELEEISLYGSGGKPSWFLKLNPSGTVPVLVCNGGTAVNNVVLPDSDLILDAIESGRAIQGSVIDLQLPESNPTLADSVKAWRNSINKMLPIGKRAVLSGDKSPLLSLLKEMDAQVVGPYLTGDQVTTADCHAFPFLWRIETEFGLADDFPNLQSWLEMCSEKPAFKKTIQPSWWWWW